MKYFNEDLKLHLFYEIGFNNGTFHFILFYPKKCVPTYFIKLIVVLSIFMFD